MIILHYFHLYGLLIGLGLSVGIWIVSLQSRYFKIDPKWLDLFLPFIVIPAIIGARLYHLITDWQLYVNKPLWSLFEIWNGGVGFFGAILGGLLGLIFAIKYSSKTNRQKPLLTTQVIFYFDLLAFGIPIAQAIGRFGNYFNQELYGLPTNLPWGIVIHGERYHPLFLYEALLNLLLFSFLFIASRKKHYIPGQGRYIGIYLIGYGLIRFSLEYLRIQTARMPGLLGIFSIAQWVALLAVCLGLVLLTREFSPKE